MLVTFTVRLTASCAAGSSKLTSRGPCIEAGGALCCRRPKRPRSCGAGDRIGPSAYLINMTASGREGSRVVRSLRKMARAPEMASRNPRCGRDLARRSGGPPKFFCLSAAATLAIGMPLASAGKRSVTSAGHWASHSQEEVRDFSLFAPPELPRALVWPARPVCSAAASLYREGDVCAIYSNALLPPRTIRSLALILF